MRTRTQTQSHGRVYAHVMSAIWLIAIFGFFQLIIGIGGALLLDGFIILVVFLVQYRYRMQQQRYDAWQAQQKRRARQSQAQQQQQSPKQQQQQVPPQQQQQQQQQSNPFWSGDLDEYYAWDTDFDSF